MSTLSNRRTFFEQLFASTNEMAVTSLDEYTTALSKADVYHLLRRCCFSIDTEFAETLVGKSAKEAIALLINNASHLDIPAPGFDTSQAFPNPRVLSQAENQIQRTKNIETHFAQNKTLIEWWIDLMKSDQNSLSEKITFFWHGHFTSQYDGGEPIPAQWMYIQNELYRNLFLSDFKTFLEKITINGTMLLYLNGTQNSKEAPNENFARELFELFSIGIGDDNYSEEDIRQAAKVLTGWRANHFLQVGPLYKSYFLAEHFSLKEKEVFGVPFVVDYEVNQENAYKNAIQKLMEVTLSEKGDKVAFFMAQKFYRYFVYSKPVLDENVIVKELALFFQESGFNVQTTLVKLLSSEHFFDSNNRGVQIKSPLENLLGFSKHFNLEASELRVLLVDFGQEPFNPPNVSGWKGYRNWITTKTLPSYIHTFNGVINDKSNFAIGNWAAEISDFNDSAKLIENIAFLFLAKLPSEARLLKLENALLGGAPYYEWPEIIENRENAGLRVKAALKELFKMPEFYLA